MIEPRVRIIQTSSLFCFHLPCSVSIASVPGIPVDVHTGYPISYSSFDSVVALGDMDPRTMQIKMGVLPSRPHAEIWDRQPIVDRSWRSATWCCIVEEGATWAAIDYDEIRLEPCYCAYWTCKYAVFCRACVVWVDTGTDAVCHGGFQNLMGLLFLFCL